MPVTEREEVGGFGWLTDPQGAVIAFIEPAPGRRQSTNGPPQLGSCSLSPFTTD
jgi:hypothetical protein